MSKKPQQCGHPYIAGSSHVPIKPERVTSEEAEVNAKKWLNGFRCDECDLWHKSPWRPLEDWRFDSLMLLAAFCEKDEGINVVTDHIIETKADGIRKAIPRGAGRTPFRDEW